VTFFGHFSLFLQQWAEYLLLGVLGNLRNMADISTLAQFFCLLSECVIQTQLIVIVIHRQPFTFLEEESPCLLALKVVTYVGMIYRVF
jgi:hypothetical protein